MTTSCPSSSRAAWTCAIDADASGAGSIAGEHLLGIGRPSSARSDALHVARTRTASRDRGSHGTRRSTRSGKRPWLDATSWPSFTYVGPSSSNVLRRMAGAASRFPRRRAQSIDSASPHPGPRRDEHPARGGRADQRRDAQHAHGDPHGERAARQRRRDQGRGHGTQHGESGGRAAVTHDEARVVTVDAHPRPAPSWKRRAARRAGRFPAERGVHDVNFSPAAPFAGHRHERDT